MKNLVLACLKIFLLVYMCTAQVCRSHKRNKNLKMKLLGIGEMV